VLANLFAAVNELSGTIDLESTLIRAEALFRKFRRLIEAIDKKNNFPAPRFSLNTAAPSLLASKPASPAANNDNANRPTTPSGSSANTQQGQANKGKQPEPPKSPGGRQKVITPELRKLLSREVVVLQRKDVVGKGDGILSKPSSAHVR
jgi:TBC1 domain family member 15